MGSSAGSSSSTTSAPLGTERHDARRIAREKNARHISRASERQGMPDHVRETHVSLFDGSNCGIELTDRPAFSVQYHPEASPGPQDSFYLFEKFVGAMR